MRKISWMLMAGAASVATSHPAYAEELTVDNVLSLSLKELTEIEVTSVSKRAEKANEAPAAIYVITEEDIKRSGATTIPDMLRMAPGITVTQAGSHSWTVTARGSNDQFSNKLLVLMDGRTIYSPLFSGVIWDVQDTMIEDIDRIEIIRGPGATLWGANAVNGVINIISKHAKDTQGGLAVATAGNRIDGIGALRYGGKIGDDSYLRAYAKHSAYDSQFNLAGNSANDSWDRSQAGFRSDSTLTDRDKLNLQGDIYTVDEHSVFTIPDLTAPGFFRNTVGTDAKGANILASWERTHSQDSITTAQMYVDHTSYKTDFFNDRTDTFDVDIQNLWTGWSGHEIVWGGGYRLVHSENDPQSVQYALNPQVRHDNLFSAFGSNEAAQKR